MDLVASFTDAWIETKVFRLLPFWRKSHLLQMRGLKQLLFLEMVLHKVASFTDAWIETDHGHTIYNPYYVASFTDAWIETIYFMF